MHGTDLAAVADAGELEPLRRHLADLPALSVRPHLGPDDFKGALGVFLLVVLATFQVVVPFMLFDQAALAVRVLSSSPS